MKKSILLLTILIGAAGNALAEEKSSLWAGEPEEKGRLEVSLDARKKTVEVVPAGKDKYPYMRLRILRKNERPLEVRLRAVDPNQFPFKYQGAFPDRGGSMMGLEVEVSFDRRSWKKIGGALRKILP